ncbi:MAG: GNAT family N-acetyltransferase, partial [Oscillospiraceae bacterium]
MIRSFLPEDKNEVLAMVTPFYTGPGVLHQIPVQNFADAYDDMVNQTPFLRGYVILSEDKIAGYIHLTFSYSCEAGGMVVSLEELFIKPDFRGKGLGNEALTFIKDEYRGKCARISLEVAPEN